MQLTLVLGGARSGKSAYAENLAKQSGNKVIYLATAEIRDEAIAQRVKLHQSVRPSEWQTVNTPIELAASLKQHAAPNVTVLVDCLTMWVTNLLCAEDKSLMAAEKSALLAVLETLPGNIIFVSNEVGMGIIPMGELTRDYVDIAGKLHQEVAAVANNAVLIVAGLPLVLK
ncbi:bifunctional adenosylcobinamide kinase/adenosylcobinamide-phosphate guanylyltransferase [Leucothrix arctica]|uniref:Bifunctional adenosylcobalamin biosynthesis protein n=1 Tax=Leucothrix arctica TaxID=1481894 RepID=A0A317C477_9GAMM|nr:bifunctional adenosylcobinamide kinase/adenosylcobinamide-phosphate guanylyltransferase [Leucothrix arctica]PWQ93455.1 bifunctional adenosylcobinamide kinase/adenosylcobinamide-phosphate guanylyltransferase [Leucothrix arctica]